MKLNYSKNTIKIAGQDIDAFRIENDQNGNPRYVIHYLNVPTKEGTFDAALNKARKIGGKKYRAKWFGGGIVFQSYNLRDSLKTLFS